MDRAGEMFLFILVGGQNLDELMESEQKRESSDDQFAPNPDPTQGLDPDAGNHCASNEVSLRRKTHRHGNPNARLSPAGISPTERRRIAKPADAPVR